MTETFPTFAWGYLWWGDGYWMSDWSYEYAPDYDRAASIYRQALAQPALEDRGDVQDRLDDLADERAHPEKREATAIPAARCKVLYDPISSAFQQPVARL